MVKTDTKRSSEISTSGTIIVARGSRISGKLKVEGHIHIDGIVEGTIYCSDYIIIGRNGRVRGTVITNKLYISGKFSGAIFTSHLEVYKTATVGTEIGCALIDCALMRIEPGATVTAVKRSEYSFSL